MEKNKNTIRPLRGALANDDYLALATLLIKAGYTVKLATQTVAGKQTKEKVILFWESDT